VTVLVGITRVNTNFIGELKTFSSNKLPNLMMVFNNIKAEEAIEVLVFVGKLPEGPSRVIRPDPILQFVVPTNKYLQTTKTSATLPFQPKIVPVEIDANHTKMVKFRSGNDAQHVITEILNMIKRKLNIPIEPLSSGVPLTPTVTILTPLVFPLQEQGKIAMRASVNFLNSILYLSSTILVPCNYRRIQTKQLLTRRNPVGMSSLGASNT
jgi:hypothetical protein